MWQVLSSHRSLVKNDFPSQFSCPESGLSVSITKCFQFYTFNSFDPQNTNKTKINELSSQLNRLAASENRIHNIEKQLRQKEAELTEFRGDNDTEKLENEIKELLFTKPTRAFDLKF